MRADPRLHGACARLRGTFLVAVMAVALAPVSAVLAQDVGSSNADTLSEVVVTARKHEERLQDVPVSLTVYDAAALERLGARDFEDVYIRTPNLYEDYLGEAKGSPPVIRGITGTNTAGADPAVGVVVDDVFYGNNTEGVFDYFDLASLEVLRGPQGTLFGRNTTGGVLNFHTRDPSDTFDGSVSTLYGNYNDVRVQGFVTGPLVAGTLDGIAAAVINRRDGFITNVYPGGSDLRSQHNWMMREGLKLTPNDSTDVNLRFDYRDSNQRGGGYKANGPNQFFNDTIPGTQSLLFVPTPPLDYTVDQNQSGSETLRAWGVSLTVDERFSGSVLRSISAYRSHNYYSIFDTDLSPNTWINDGSPEKFHQLTQEIRWSSAPGSPQVWILGLYYYHGDSLDTNFITFQKDILPILGFPPGTPNLTTQANGSQVSQSYAAYGHYEVPFGKHVALSLGARFTHDHKTLDYLQADPSDFFGGGFAEREAHSWQATTGDASLSYKWTPDILTYVSVARGYKAGGFNDGIGELTNPPFAPEFVLTYESGLKSTFLDHRLRLDLSAFYLDWKDIQTAGFGYDSQTLEFTYLTGNFAHAYSRGGELEFAVLPIPALELTMNAGLQEGRIPPNESAQVKGADALTGPKYTIDWGVQLTEPVGGGNLILSADALLRGPQDFIQGAPTPGYIISPYQHSFTLLSGRLTYRLPDGKQSIALWGKNLTDKAYFTKYFDLGGNPFLPPAAIVLGEPRMYGVEYKVDF